MNVIPTGAVGRFVGTLLILVVGILIAGADARAQVGSTAQINGTVKDTSGGVLPGVDVTVTQTTTGLTRSVVTDDTGSFTLPNLPVGPYRLEVALSGFRTYVQTGIVLQVNSNPTFNVELSLGELTETVSVEASAPLIETRSPSVGQVIENERIEQLPLNGRNPTDLIQLAGAAVSQGASSSRSMQGGQAISVAGGQSFGVAYVLDGASHNNPYDNLNLPLPFPDALQEFRVETSALTAQNGMHTGAAVNAVTKSGTNQFHGDLFTFARNHRFNATNPFAAVRNGERQGDGLNRNQFGGTLGGPIQTDRVFFFGAYQGTITDQTPSDNIAFVPTAAMLAGDFSQIASAACNAGRAITLRGPFADNRVSPGLLSPAALQISRRLPATTDPCGRVAYSRRSESDEIQAIGKVDVQVSTNHTIFGRYMATTYVQPPPFSFEDANILASTIGGRDNLAQSFTAGDTLVLSSNVVNSLRFAWNRTAIHRTHTDYFSAPDVGINSYSYLPDYMLLAVNNAFNIGGGTENEAQFTTPAYHLNNDVTLVRGNHQFSAGGGVSYWQSLSVANVRSPGQFTFDGQVTGLPIADFLTGNLASLRQSAPNTLDMQQWYMGFYGQDVWRLSNNVTLNYGLRWEPHFPQQLRNGSIYNFDLERFRSGIRSSVFRNAPAGFTYPGDEGFPNGNAGMDESWLNFSPRAGLAWDPRGDGLTSIRVGYSLGYDFVNGQFHINTANAPPWGSEVFVQRPLGGFEDPFRDYPGGNPFPATFDQNAFFPVGGSFLAIPPDLENTKQHSWNASVQRQIGADFAVSASYIGNYTTNLWNLEAINPGVFIPGQCTTTTTINQCRVLTMQNPAEGRFIAYLDQFNDQGNQKYNGLLLTAQRRATDSLSFSANYTLSKCEGHPTQGGGTPNPASGYVNPGDIDYDYGRCNSDRRHVFNLTASVETPEFDRTALRMVASGWRLSGIFRAASGSPLNIITGVDRALSGINNQRPNQVLDDPYGDGSWTNYLNRAAFEQPALGTLGNTPRNSVTGPGAKVVDLSLVRGFRFAASQRIEARVEAFNAFNWFRPLPNPPLNNAPVVNLTSPTFGQILAADDPRILQFAVKYSF
jgi:hypothetical protein